MEEIILQARGICAGYRDMPVLEGVDIDIKRGKVCSIIGPNGCGKTTLIKVLSRNLRPRSGSVLLDGGDIFKTNTRLVARKMAVLSQNNSSFSEVNVKTLVSFGRYAHKKWWHGGDAKDTRIVEWALETTGMTKFADRKISDLSGGERQRAWIAMSIAQRPDILLLDEPTTYLDISHQLEIMELVRKLNEQEGMTIVMVLHDINHAVRYSNELIVIKDHRVWETGDPWSILNDGVLCDVFNVEAEIMKDAESGKPVFYAKRVVNT